jgi:SAM-dependent methyltransferase
MGRFPADWLALREPADARARSAKLTRLVADRLKFKRAAELHILDLAAGTGANARYLAEVLPSGRVQWLLVDKDRELLARAAAQAAAQETIDPLGLDQVETRVVDLASAFVPAAEDICAGRDLVTASALLDLVSERWLRMLARRCRDSGAAVLFALTYNGDVRCTPEEREDDTVRELVNRHQCTDKGFGPALGPEASERAAETFAALGYEVRCERSDWSLATDDRDLQAQLIEGWADAAAVIAPDRSALLQSWRARRLAHVATGRSRLVVGHEDLVGWL